MKQKTGCFIGVMSLLLLLLFAGAISYAYAQGTVFTYQGRLQDAGTNANGSYDFKFTLLDALSGGAYGINNLGVVVGYYRDQNNVARDFLFDGQLILDNRTIGKLLFEGQPKATKMNNDLWEICRTNWLFNNSQNRFCHFTVQMERATRLELATFSLGILITAPLFSILTKPLRKNQRACVAYSACIA